MDKNILFSICIPSYHSSNNIEAAVLSVYRQNYSDYEIIICDQGDTDSSFLLKKYNNIKIIYLHEPSTYNARAELIRAVSGDYFIQLDDDDVIATNTLSTLSKIIKQTNYRDVYCYKKRNEPDDNRESIDKNVFYYLTKDNFINMCLRRCGGFYNDMLTKCFKKISNFSYIPKKIVNNEDGYILLELLDYYSSFIFIETTLYIHTNRPNSISKRRTLDRISNQATYNCFLVKKLGLEQAYESINGFLYDIYNYFYYLNKDSLFDRHTWKRYRRNKEIQIFVKLCRKHFFKIAKHVKAKKYLFIICLNMYLIFRLAFHK